MSRRLIVSAIVAAAVAGTVAQAHGSATPRARSATTCANLVASPVIRAKLSYAYQKAHRGSTRKMIGPLKGTTYYGVCGSTHWAIGEFANADGSEMDDQPETLRQLAGKGWVDRGDDGTICSIPKTLTKIWGKRALQAGICGIGG